MISQRLVKKRKGNPNWGRPASATTAAQLTEFEKTALQLGLAESDWGGSTALRQWAYRHRNSRYVPEDLLKAWRIGVDDSLEGRGWGYPPGQY